MVLREKEVELLRIVEELREESEEGNEVEEEEEKEESEGKVELFLLNFLISFLFLISSCFNNCFLVIFPRPGISPSIFFFSVKNTQQPHKQMKYLHIFLPVLFKKMKSRKRSFVWLNSKLRKIKKKFNLNNNSTDIDEDLFDTLLLLKEQGNFLLFEQKLLEISSSVSSTSLTSLTSLNDNKVRAIYELGLLYCQFNKKKKANKYLRQLGYKYKLGRGIWNYNERIEQQGGEQKEEELQQNNLHLFSSSSLLNSQSSITICYENIFPSIFLNHLCQIFSSSSTFWSSHNYPTSQFFSYNISLKKNQNEKKSKKSRKAQFESDCNNEIQKIVNNENDDEENLLNNLNCQAPQNHGHLIK